MKIFFPIFFCCLLILCHNNSVAQILIIDREAAEDTSYRRWGLSAALNLSSDKQKNNIIDLGSDIEIDRFFKNRYVFIGQFKNDALFSGRSVIQNEGQFHLRYRDNDTRKYSIELYLQNQWNGQWGMEYRFLQGINLRLKLYDRSGSDFYSAIGLFHEQERWNWTGVKSIVPDNASDRFSKRIRFNTYLKYAKKISDLLDVSTLTYLQFPIQGIFFKPRWYQDLNLNINANKHLSFLIHWDHIYDEQRIVPIESFYYSFSTGLQFKF